MGSAAAGHLMTGTPRRRLPLGQAAALFARLV